MTELTDRLVMILLFGHLLHGVELAGLLVFDLPHFAEAPSANDVVVEEGVLRYLRCLGLRLCFEVSAAHYLNLLFLF
jgi:hypothetical protein